MAVLPEVQEHLDRLRLLGAPSAEQVPVAQFRAASQNLRFLQGPVPALPKPPRDLTIQSRAKLEIPLRIFSPIASPVNLPVIVFFHGGGWVRGTLDLYDTPCRLLALAAKAIVVSVDYRLSPEAKFPSALEDADDVYHWVKNNTAGWGGNPNRIFVSGDSSGGNLAAALSLWLRERNETVPAGQLLFYPVMNHEFETPSYQEFAQGFGLSKEGMKYFWSLYLSSPEEGKNPLASPGSPKNFENLPPSLVITAENDPLRDEAEQYIQDLKSAHVDATLIRGTGLIHGFMHMITPFPTVLPLYTEAGNWIQKNS